MKRRRGGSMLLRIAAGSCVVLACCALSLWLALFAARRVPALLVGSAKFPALRAAAALRIAPLVGRRPVILLGDSRIEALDAASIHAPRALVVNTGISGSTAEQWCSMIPVPAKAGSGAVFVVWVGINDMINLGHGPAEAASDVRRLVDALLRAPDSRVLLLEQIPVELDAEHERAINDDIVLFNRALATLASQLPRIQLIALYASLRARDSRALYSDGLHLNERGNAWLAARLGATLQ